MISDDDISRVREATDLVALVSESVVLKQKGREFWGRCPFHDEKTPSFKVDPRSQLYHCFGCHAGGDAYGFVMRTQNMEFLDAVRYLAERANYTLTETKGSASQGKRARLLSLMDASAEFYSTQLLRTTTAGAKAAREYLGKRGMGLELAKRWQLGYAPGNLTLVKHLQARGYTLEECIEANVAVKNQQGRIRDRFYERVIFPVCDLQGRTIAFGGRVMNQQEPKYLNTSETLLFRKRETLYAIDRAKSAMTSKGTAIVVEGYTDTIAMHDAGFTQTVATLGTALTTQHLKLLNRFAKKVIYLFDGDEAGKRAAVRAAELITNDITPESGRFRISLEVAELPPGVDPADLLAQKGVEALQTILDKASPLLRYAIQQSLRNADLSCPEGRNAALREALEVLLPIRGSILANEYIADELAPQLGVDYAQALALFSNMTAPRKPDALGKARSSQESGSTKPGERDKSTSDIKITGAHQDNRATSAGLQRELIILYLEYPEVRDLLAKAFELITWSGEELTVLIDGLLAAERRAESDELYALVHKLAPTYAATLSAGLQQNFVGSVHDYARMLMYMLRETQLLNEIAVAKIAYAQAATDSEKDVQYKEIALKQSDLATIRERLAEIPKTLM